MNGNCDAALGPARIVIGKEGRKKRRKQRRACLHVPFSFFPFQSRPSRPRAHLKEKVNEAQSDMVSVCTGVRLFAHSEGTKSFTP